VVLTGGTVVSGDMPGAVVKPPDGVPRSAGSPGAPGSHSVDADTLLVSGDMPDADEKPPLSAQGSALVMPAETGWSRGSPLTPAPLVDATSGDTVVSGDMPAADENPPLGVPRSAGRPGTPASPSIGADATLDSGACMPGADEKPPLGVVAANTGETANTVAIRKANGRAATVRLERRNRRAPPRAHVVSISTHLDQERVHLGGRVARSLVDTHDRFARRPA